MLRESGLNRLRETPGGSVTETGLPAHAEAGKPGDAPEARDRELADSEDGHRPEK